jgi:hypothetical protein
MSHVTVTKPDLLDLSGVYKESTRSPEESTRSLQGVYKESTRTHERC